MTSLFTLPSYPEDQQHAHAILYLHVMRASAMSFTFLSLFRLPISLARDRYNETPVDMRALFARTLRTSGRSLVLGTFVGAAATWGRMRGRDDIEWQDRPWIILENGGEVKTDWVTIGGAGAGAVACLVAARRGVIPATMGSAALGGIGLGTSVGVTFMIATFATGRKSA
jgi:hypothetical protein